MSVRYRPVQPTIPPNTPSDHRVGSTTSVSVPHLAYHHHKGPIVRGTVTIPAVCLPRMALAIGAQLARPMLMCARRKFQRIGQPSKLAMTELFKIRWKWGTGLSGRDFALFMNVVSEELCPWVVRRSYCCHSRQQQSASLGHAMRLCFCASA